MTDLHDTLDQIKARAEMASDGPWEVYDANEGMFPPRPLWSVDNEANRNYEDYDEDEIWPAIDLHLDTGLKTDAEFIAAARDDVPRLVEALEAVMKEADDADKQDRLISPDILRKRLADKLTGGEPS